MSPAAGPKSIGVPGRVSDVLVDPAVVDTTIKDDVVVVSARVVVGAPVELVEGIEVVVPTDSTPQETTQSIRARVTTALKRLMTLRRSQALSQVTFVPNPGSHKAVVTP
jgi:hypothetical protein